MVNNTSISPVFVNMAPKGQRAEYVQAKDIVGIQQSAKNPNNYNVIVKTEQINGNGMSNGVRYENNEVSSDVIHQLNLIG